MRTSTTPTPGLKQVSFVTLLLCLVALPLAAQQDSAPYCNLIASATLAMDGRTAMQEGDHAKAIRQLRQAFDACPSQHSLLLELAQAFTGEREFQEAIGATQRFLEKEPESVPGRVVLANAYFMAQHLPEARQQAEEILKTDPQNPAALKLKGNCEYLLGEIDPAQKTFAELLDLHPDDEDAAYMLGRIYYQEGRIDHAIGQFQRVLKLNPYSYRAYDNLGLCYEAQSQVELAIRHFLTAIKLVEKDYPDYDWPYANLANLLIDNGDAEKAFSAAVKAAERNPSSARNFFLGGKALWKLGKFDLCVRWLQRSVELDENYPEPLYLLARVYSQLGRKDEAREVLEKFREVKAKTPRERR